MSSVSVPTDRSTSWAVICDYQSGHCLHLSVVFQRVRRQSLERPEPRLTLCFKTAPPLRHLFLGKLRGGVWPLPESPCGGTAGDWRRRIVTPITTKSAVSSHSKKKGLTHHCPHVEQRPFRHTAQVPQVRHPPCRPRDGLRSSLTVQSQRGVLLRRQPPRQRRIQLHMVRKILHQRLHHLSLYTRASTSQGASDQKRKTSLLVKVRTFQIERERSVELRHAHTFNNIAAKANPACAGQTQATLETPPSRPPEYSHTAPKHRLDTGDATTQALRSLENSSSTLHHTAFIY